MHGSQVLIFELCNCIVRKSLRSITAQSCTIRSGLMDVQSFLPCFLWLSTFRPPTLTRHTHTHTVHTASYQPAFTTLGLCWCAFISWGEVRSIPARSPLSTDMLAGSVGQMWSTLDKGGVKSLWFTLLPRLGPPCWPAHLLFSQIASRDDGE